MAVANITEKEKKLKNMRKILWICFAGLSAPIVLFTMPFSVLENMDEVMDTINGMNIPAWPFFIMSQVLAISLIGGICLIIYHVFKYRIDKRDDNLFI